MAKQRYRRYRLSRNALNRAAKLTADLAEVNRSRVERGLSQVDRYFVGSDPYGFAYIVWALFEDGRRALTA